MKRICELLLLCCVVTIVSPAYIYGEPESAKGLPVLNPEGYLMQDDYVRSKLNLTKEQIETLDVLCDKLDPLLFSMRDVPPYSTDQKAIKTVQAINKELELINKILIGTQLRRFEQITFQYMGTTALLYPAVQKRLGFLPMQSAKLQAIRAEALSDQRRLQEQGVGEGETLQEKIQEIQREEMNQMLGLMSNGQRQLWLNLLGDAFDFSKVKPMSFKAPELKGVTEWINTKPISMKDLRGRVVIVHFWTFGCSNCIQNYPVYRQWTQQYDPKEVFILGIHTPETTSEKDIAVLKQRMAQEKLTFAAAVDNDKKIWDAWTNRTWPSVYLVDKKGRVRYWWYGELRWQGATGDKWIAERIEELKQERL